MASLSVQLDGFQAFAERVGPEATTRLLRQYYTVCEALLREYDGAPERYDGPRLTAVFGIQGTETDHALRAARTALAIRQRLERQRPAWRSDGYELALCCGLAAGFAHVTPPAYDEDLRAFGATLELAEHLEASAEPGTILADPAAVADLGDTVTRTELGPRTLPGYRQALTVSRIDGEVNA